MASEEGTVKLASLEGEEFEVPIAVAKMSQLVADTLFEDEDDSDEDEDDVKIIPLFKVRTEILKLIIDYCTHYQEEPMTAIQSPLKSSHLEDLVQKWYVDFVDVEQKVLFDLVAAVNFMDIKPLMDLSCLAVSIVIKSKTPEELKVMFKVNTDNSGENAQAATS